jgi:hypothetical protein
VSIALAAAPLRRIASDATLNNAVLPTAIPITVGFRDARIGAAPVTTALAISSTQTYFTL